MESEDIEIVTDWSLELYTDKLFIGIYLVTATSV